MAPIMFIQNGFKFLNLRRAIKACIYINRLLKDGLDMDFNLEKIRAEDEPVESSESIK